MGVQCKICGEILTKDILYAPKTIMLSKTRYVYNKKARKPSVKVKDAQGNIIESSNYTVTYQNNKKVGKAMVVISFKNNYSGTLQTAFTIQPKTTKITKFTPKAKGFVIKWKKQNIQMSGYVIEYSTNSKFTGKQTKKLFIKGGKITTKTIKKLKANKTYCIRIGTYKTVKVKGKKQKIYSDWSKTKKIKTL